MKPYAYQLTWIRAISLNSGVLFVGVFFPHVHAGGASSVRTECYLCDLGRPTSQDQCQMLIHFTISIKIFVQWLREPKQRIFVLRDKYQAWLSSLIIVDVGGSFQFDYSSLLYYIVAIFINKSNQLSLMWNMYYWTALGKKKWKPRSSKSNRHEAKPSAGCFLKTEVSIFLPEQV